MAEAVGVDAVEVGARGFVGNADDVVQVADDAVDLLSAAKIVSGKREDAEAVFVHAVVAQVASNRCVPRENNPTLTVRVLGPDQVIDKQLGTVAVNAPKRMHDMPIRSHCVGDPVASQAPIDQELRQRLKPF